MDIIFFNHVDDSKLSFAVIIARMNCRWVLCKHRDRTTYEFPGGHRESGESIEETARRELHEETGAVAYSLERICDYSVRGVTRVGEELNEETYGTLFFSKISFKEDTLNSEIEKVELKEDIPNNLTYPAITSKLIEKAMGAVLQSEKVIDIYSKGEYPANVLSNFYPNRFVFDGVECASMEGFLQSLKYRNGEQQKAVCRMVGKEAKIAGMKKFLWKLTGNLYWRGKRYKRNSSEFDSLRLTAYKAMLSNEGFRAALQCTEGQILKHSMRKHKKRETVLTEKEFLWFLNQLRKNLK